MGGKRMGKVKKFDFFFTMTYSAKIYQIHKTYQRLSNMTNELSHAKGADTVTDLGIFSLNDLPNLFCLFLTEEA
jgi:hypothetical protein